MTTYYLGRLNTEIVNSMRKLYMQLQVNIEPISSFKATCACRSISVDFCALVNTSGR